MLISCSSFVKELRGGISKESITHSWGLICEHYHKKSIKQCEGNIPEIMYIDESVKDINGYTIYGLYNHNNHTIYLYGNLDYSILIHEMQHAAGDTLEENLCYINRYILDENE